MIDIKQLSGLDLFRGTAPDVLKSLAASATELSFAPEETLFLEGSAPRGWWLVLEGRVRVVRDRGPRQHVVHTETAGGTLGEVPLFTHFQHPATGIASEPTRCALWTRRALESAMEKNPQLALLLLRLLALRVNGLVNRLDQRSAQPVRSRLADYLLARQRDASGDTISLGMTQQRLAEELGTVREVVARELFSLRRDGFIVSRGGGRYTIADANGLRRAGSATAT